MNEVITSDAALARLITDPDVLEFQRRWPAIEVDEETRARTTARAAELLAERDRAAYKHAKRIVVVARRVGRRLSLGETTTAEAEQTLRPLVLARDVAHPLGVYIVPIKVGRLLALIGLAAGIQRARKVMRRA